MSIRDKIRLVNPRQEKSVKFTPISEGGLGLSPGLNNDDIKKPKQNVQTKYWYDKYEELVKEVSYHRKMDRQNLTELEDKVVVINEGLLDEIASINNSDPLTPLDKKFVTFDQLAEHYKLFINRIQVQIATIGGGGIGDVVDDPSPQLGGNLDTNGNDVTFKGATSNLTWDASANDLEFDDDSRLKFGDGEDFQIWHGGTHTFMKNSTGEFRIRGDIISLERADDTEKYLEANVNEDVKLFYNGDEKFATTNTGVSVTGNVVISNDGNIGSVGDTDSIAIDSSGVVTFSQTPVFSSDLTISDDLNLLSDGAAIYFGADKDVFAFHVHNLGLSLKNTSTADDTPFVLTLQTGETDIAANDVLGRIQFQAPDEGTGSDAVAISAAIQAISEGDFSSSSNATALGFLTGVSGTATTKMTLSSAGNLTITGDAKVGTSQSAGVILTSPDSTEYRLIVANGGALSTSAV